MDAGADIGTGHAWLVDAYGCDPVRLRSTDALARFFRDAVREMGLVPVREPVWHVFGGPGGVTGFLLLSESHLSVHTFPERGFAAIDLYCCRPRAPWRWDEALAEALGAASVVVRCAPRGEDRT
jgi:S-adenosylmethionine decarboxylase